MSSMNRHSRRADPPRWYKLDAFVDKRSGKEVHGLSDEHAQYVLGQIDKIVIVKIPDEMNMAERMAFMEGFHAVAALAGDKQFILVPSSVTLARLSPVDAQQSKELDRNLKTRQITAAVAAEKASAQTVGAEPIVKPS